MFVSCPDFISSTFQRRDKQFNFETGLNIKKKTTC